MPTAASSVSAESDQARLADHDVHASASKVGQIGGSRLPLRRCHGSLNRSNRVELKDGDQLGAVLACHSHHVAAADFIAAQAGNGLGQRHMLVEIIVIENCGIGGLLKCL